MLLLFRQTKADANDAIANDIKGIKETLSSIKIATDTNTAEIKALAEKTDLSARKSDDQNVASNPFRFRGRPNTAPAMEYVHNYRERAMNKAYGTPASAKRQRTDTPARLSPRRNLQLPTPKMGTKSNVTGLSVVQTPHTQDTRRETKPKFEEALWIFRLGPGTTCDDVINYITSNTSVAEKSSLSAHMLVKKGTDVTSLRFVSFKVEMNAADLDVLNDPNLLPENVQVREFMQRPEGVRLGDFFSKANGKQAASGGADMMEQ